MRSPSDSPPAAAPAVVIKARAFTLPLVRLMAPDMDAVADELAVRAAQIPELFRDAPVVIDLDTLSTSDTPLEFPVLVGLLRGYGMVPVGVWRGSATQNEAARAMDLAVVATSLGNPPRGAGKAHAAAGPQADRVIRVPVRSGQRFYAAGGDLVVLSQVGSGAEVIADGSIHVYGSLRGRAIAGVKGDEDACVFCREFGADLVSIAGHYRTADALDPDLSGNPVYVRLEKQRLRFEIMR